MSYPGENSPTAEVGSNWYLRGDVGAEPRHLADGDLLDRISIPPQGNASTAAVAKFRRQPVQHEFSRRHRRRLPLQQLLPRSKPPTNTATAPAATPPHPVICPYGAYGVSNQAGTVQYGYLYNTTEHMRRRSQPDAAQQRRRSPTVISTSAPYWGVTPYVGAGAGLNVDLDLRIARLRRNGQRPALRRRPVSDRNVSANLGRRQRQRRSIHAAQHRLHHAGLEPLDPIDEIQHGRGR